MWWISFYEWSVNTEDQHPPSPAPSSSLEHPIYEKIELLVFTLAISGLFCLWWECVTGCFTAWVAIFIAYRPPCHDSVQITWHLKHLGLIQYGITMFVWISINFTVHCIHTVVTEWWTRHKWFHWHYSHTPQKHWGQPNMPHRLRKISRKTVPVCQLNHGNFSLILRWQLITCQAESTLRWLQKR